MVETLERQELPCTVARLLTAEELHGYDLVLGPKSCAEDGVSPWQTAFCSLCQKSEVELETIQRK